MTLHVARNDSVLSSNPVPMKGKAMKSDIKHSTVSATKNDGGDVRRTNRRHRPSINITPVERIGRIVVGSAAVVVGVVLLTSAIAAVAIILEVLLVAAGVDLVVTGSLGHCPLYAKLGHVPTSLGKSS